MSKRYLIGQLILILSLYSYQTDLVSNTYPMAELCICLILFSIQRLAVIIIKKHGINEFPNKSHLFMGKIVLIIIIYLLLIVKKEFFIFLPAFFFILDLRENDFYLYFALIPLAALMVNASLYQFLFVFGQSFIASLMNTFFVSNSHFEQKSYQEIDRLRNINELSKRDQENLINLQDNLIASSILKERRRIIGEIHDILGHQLSSTIIQIAALEYLELDPNVKESLKTIKNTLTTSMDNVRSIIHVEKANSIDLQSEIQSLVDQFTKCKITFTYKNTANFSNQAAHSILNMIKESLTNINKHSNATRVNLSIQETDNYLTLLIADNGNKILDLGSSQGIGLISMEERVQRLRGKIHITTDKGFRIFILIPKEVDYETNDR